MSPNPRNFSEENALFPNEKAVIDQISLSNGNQVEIDAEANEIRVFNSENRICLHVIMTDQGPVLNFESAGIRLKARENLTLESENIHLMAENSIKIQSDGDLKQLVKGDLTSKARIQHIQARLGNVNIKANDDVRLDGERVKLNCSK